MNHEEHCNRQRFADQMRPLIHDRFGPLDPQCPVYVSLDEASAETEYGKVRIKQMLELGAIEVGVLLLSWDKRTKSIRIDDADNVEERRKRRDLCQAWKKLYDKVGLEKTLQVIHHYNHMEYEVDFHSTADGWCCGVDMIEGGGTTPGVALFAALDHWSLGSSADPSAIRWYESKRADREARIAEARAPQVKPPQKRFLRIPLKAKRRR